MTLPGTDDELAQRLARLEREMGILRVELARLRERVGAPASASSAVPTPATRPESAPRAESAAPNRGTTDAPRRVSVLPAASQPGRSVEELVGRYATIATATITVLVGVGIFLSWAIERALLGPMTRVILGYVAALGVAAGGAWLRIRGTREFGNVLLAMALAIVHLVSWSAGPLLHVIPSWASLAIGALASAVLAEFALRHEEEALCAVGFGGAALAPFLLSDSDGNRIVLAVYGLVVIALGVAALRLRTWRIARRVTIGSFFLYTITVGFGNGANSPPAWVAARLWVLFPLAALYAFIPLAHPPYRRMLVRTAAAGLFVGAVLRTAFLHGPDIWTVVLTMLGAAVAIAVLDLTRPGALESETANAPVDEPLAPYTATIDAFLLPVALLAATLLSMPKLVSLSSAFIAALWALAMTWMAHRTRAEPEADPYASGAALISLAIVPMAFRAELSHVAGYAVLGMVLMLAALRMVRLPFLFGSFAALTLASGFALISITELPRFAYAPFFTPQTLGCMIAIVGWLTTARIARQEGFLPQLDRDGRLLVRRALAIGGAATAFAWGVGELRGAWNPSASTALLIVYYATTGTFMIWLGRRRAVKPLRVIGLLLSLWAAWKAVAQAFDIPNVAVRIAVFFAVSAFLIAVGYWYRNGAGDDDSAVRTRPTDEVAA